MKQEWLTVTSDDGRVDIRIADISIVGTMYGRHPVTDKPGFDLIMNNGHRFSLTADDFSTARTMRAEAVKAVVPTQE